MSDITRQPEAVRSFAPVSQRQRESRAFAASMESFVNMQQELEQSQRLLNEANTRVTLLEKFLDVVKEDNRRLRKLAEFHQNSHTAVTTSLKNVCDLLSGIVQQELENRNVDGSSTADNTDSDAWLFGDPDNPKAQAG